eukprot:GDKH01000151.1.p1 GENE.GDKH01000151.1~~GDKH01000151.1.p1  ORF type:complete len:155 (-),score=33.46 GDKH01000151.1:310-774(-)
MVDNTHSLIQATRVVGFVGGLLTFSVGLVHLFVNAGVALRWPSRGADFVQDVNAASWRHALFSLDPAIIADAWTPFFVGLIGMVVHFASFHSKLLTGNFLRYGVFLLFTVFWANFAYAGGWGIVVGAWNLLGVLLCLVSHAAHKGHEASLDLRV